MKQKNPFWPTKHLFFNSKCTRLVVDKNTCISMDDNVIKIKVHIYYLV